MTEIFNEIAVAANLVFFAVLSVSVQVVFFDGVTRYLPEMRQVPFCVHLRVPVDTGTTNAVSAILRERFALVAFTVNPAWAGTAVAVVLCELLFAPTTNTLYARPFTRPVNVQVVATVVHREVVPRATAVYSTSLPEAADHETVSDLSPAFTATPGTTPTCASGVADTCCDALDPNELTLSTVNACATPPVRPVTTQLVSVVEQTIVPDEFFTRYDEVLAVAVHESVTDSSPAVAPDTVGADGNTPVVAVRAAEASDVPAMLVVFTVTVYDDPEARPVTVHAVPVVVHVPPFGDTVTV